MIEFFQFKQLQTSHGHQIHQVAASRMASSAWSSRTPLLMADDMSNFSHLLVFSTVMQSQH